MFKFHVRTFQIFHKGYIANREHCVYIISCFDFFSKCIFWKKKYECLLLFIQTIINLGSI